MRSRGLYNLWLGGFITAGSIAGFIWESHAAIIGIVIGAALLISGGVALRLSKSEQLKPPRNGLE